MDFPNNYQQEVEKLQIIAKEMDELTFMIKDQNLEFDIKRKTACTMS